MKGESSIFRTIPNRSINILEHTEDGQHYDHPHHQHTKSLHIKQINDFCDDSNELTRHIDPLKTNNNIEKIISNGQRNYL